MKTTNPAAWLAYTVYERILAKLEREPIEDNRIDFQYTFPIRRDGSKVVLRHVVEAADRVLRVVEPRVGRRHLRGELTKEAGPLPTIHGLHQHEDVRFLAMELVEGEDLAERIARGPISTERVVETPMYSSS